VDIDQVHDNGIRGKMITSAIDNGQIAMLDGGPLDGATASGPMTILMEGIGTNK